VLEPILIVALRVVFAGMSPPALPAVEGRVDGGLADLEQIPKLYSLDQFGVIPLTPILQADMPVALKKLLEFFRPFG